MAEKFSDKYLGELSILLRDENYRRSISHDKIQQVFNHLIKNSSYQNTPQLHTCILSIKILSNYIADVPENCEYLMKLIGDKLPILPINHEISNFNTDIEEFVLYYKVQLILISNILTTSKESISEKVCNAMFDKLIKLFMICESDGIDIDNEILIEIFEEFQTILKKIDFNQFLLLKDLCKVIKEIAEADGDDDLFNLSNKVILYYSCNLKVEEMNELEKEELFFKLFNDLSDIKDEEILLNISFELKIQSDYFFEKLINLIFDIKGNIKINKRILPMAMIIISNEITNKNKMNFFLDKVSIFNLNEIYFNEIYPKLTLRSQWEFQSIILLNKIPNLEISIGIKAINNYLNTLSKLISFTTLQIRFEVIKLQFIYLSKILSISFEDEENQRFELINNFLNDLKLSNEYIKFPTEFKLLLNQVYFPYLNNHKDKLINEEFKRILRNILNDSSDLINKSIHDQTPVQIKYLIELSQIFGFYVKDFKNDEWFVKSFKSFETIIKKSQNDIDRNNSDNNDNNKEMSNYEKTAWKVLNDNFKYSEIILNNNVNI